MVLPILYYLVGAAVIIAFFMMVHHISRITYELTKIGYELKKMNTYLNGKQYSELFFNALLAKRIMRVSAKSAHIAINQLQKKGNFLFVAAYF
jgi:hypothetical protein